LAEPVKKPTQITTDTALACVWFHDYGIFLEGG